MMRMVRNLFFRKSVEQELEDEIRFHYDQQVAKFLAEGLPLSEAQRRARLIIGGIEQIKEDCRDVRGVTFLETLLQDVRFALRLMRKTATSTAVAILSLALGIGANTAIFSLVNAVMLKMLPVSRPEELVQIQIFRPRESGEAVTSLTNTLWQELKKSQNVFSSVLAWGNEQLDLSSGGSVHYVRGIWVSGDFFSTLELQPANGRLIETSDDTKGCAAVAVLSYGFWQEHFGGAGNAIGTVLSLNGQPFQVIGVAPANFYGMEVGRKFDVAAPICAVAYFSGGSARLTSRSSWWLNVMGRIKPGISRSQANAQLKSVSPQVFQASLPQDWSPEMQERFLHQEFGAVPAATGISDLRQDFDRPLRTLLWVVGVVLLIACANMASLVLARATARKKEIALRQALGANRSRLIRQLLTECFMLSATGALLGIFFARWAAAVLVRFLSTSQSAVFLDLSLNVRVLAFTIATSIVAALLFGLLPAMGSTRISLASAMKDRLGSDSERPLRLQLFKWIVATQMALSLVLLVAAGLLLHSFVRLAKTDLGFDHHGVLLVHANFTQGKVPVASQVATAEEIENALRSIPGVVSTSRSIFTPLSGNTWNQWIRTDWSADLKGSDALAWFNSVSPDFFNTMRMNLLSGRIFTGADSKTSPAVAVINQTLATRFFPGRNPLGQTFRIDQFSDQPGNPIEVIGVVKDAKYESARERTLPTAFLPVTQSAEEQDDETFELRTAVSPSSLVSTVNSVIGTINRQIPLNFETLARQVDDSMVVERLLAVLSGFFGALTLLLAVIGLYGTLSYLVTQRQAEFGIRMALGATRGAILGLVIRDILMVLSVGIMLGFFLSLIAGRLLQGLLFEVGPHDPASVAIAVLVLILVALVAGFLPAHRATRVDPMVALRNE